MRTEADSSEPVYWRAIWRERYWDVSLTDEPNTWAATFCFEGEGSLPEPVARAAAQAFAARLNQILKPPA